MTAYFTLYSPLYMYELLDAPLYFLAVTILAYFKPHTH